MTKQPCNWPGCDQDAKYDCPLTREAMLVLVEMGQKAYAWAFLCGAHFAMYGLQTTVTKRIG